VTRPPIADRLRSILPAANRGATSPVPVASVAVDMASPDEWRKDPIRSFRWAPTATYAGERIGTLAARLAEAQPAAVLITRGAVAPAPLLFFDLETTGLAGGAGTHAFLVGCASFDADGGFLVRQFLLTSIGRERSMLEAVHGELGRAGTLVSFNGKSFDAPLLETRYLYHRLPWLGPETPHLDVLHAARRFWGEPARRVGMGHVVRNGLARPGGDMLVRPGCSLAGLERQVLGAERVDDVPGSDIPSRYFAYVRSGDARPLDAVLEHNRLDLLSLAALTTRLLHLVSEGPSAVGKAREALALGRVYERAGLEVRASEAFDRALDLAGDSDPVTTLAALRGLATLNRRTRQHDQAALRWKEILALPGCPPDCRREAAEALAVHHEHRAGDLVGAKELALSALEVAADAKRPGLLYRLARIDRKLTRGDERRGARINESGGPTLLDSLAFSFE
jgi:uncharacterized protein YprB with RNaseH-like and TPR domain